MVLLSLGEAVAICPTAKNTTDVILEIGLVFAYLLSVATSVKNLANTLT
ncbi:MAG: hypothetical protein ACXITR_08475 [Cyanobacterium sp.]